MKKIVIIKYGELTTKKDNINLFISTLRDEVKRALDGLSAEISYDKGRMFIGADDEYYDKIILKLQKVFGIHEINLGYQIDDNSIEEIEKQVIELVSERDFKTFKVETKRSDKTYPLTSMEVSRAIGGVILKNKDGIKVDVHNPEVVVHVEIRHNKSYIYFDKIAGLGGYPVGVLGKGMLMLSGGIDSPVAGYLAMKRGVRIEGVYFESPPHTSEAAKNKVISLAKTLADYSGYIKLHVVNFTKIQETILKECPREYLITIMRRMMYRIAYRIALKNNAKVIINGESIGQVASQTLTSMYAINSVIDMPVIRPVACFDKLDIIDIAKKIETYDISIQPFEDCCTIFVPEHPVINPDRAKCSEYETYFDYESLIDEAIRNEEVIKVENKVSREFNNIL